MKFVSLKDKNGNLREIDLSERDLQSLTYAAQQKLCKLSNNMQAFRNGSLFEVLFEDGSTAKFFHTGFSNTEHQPFSEF